MSTTRETLVQRYLDGTISAAEMSELSARLNADAEARRAFAEELNLDSALAAVAAGWAADMPESRVESVIPHSRRAIPAAVRRLAIAASILLVISGGWWWQTHRTTATVAKVAGVKEFAAGTALGKELRQIDAGSVELLTARGARIVIEAPAEFRFESAQRLRMIRGRLSAEVPPAAKGFTVITPAGDAVDLGTRFGVDVPPSGAAEIHVFDGQVIAKASGVAAEQSLHGGQAVTMERGTSAARELRSAAFIGRDELPELTAGLAAGQQARSQAVLAALRDDPALVALLDFESAESHMGDFRLVQGRWPGSRAPEFVGAGDHLKLDVGGDRTYPQLTLAAWVRLDRLGAPYQSLLHTDGWNKSPGQVHWMVTRHTTMRMALSGNTLVPGSVETEHFPDSRTSVLPERGHWVHLAVVYDSDAGTVRFYLNGRFDNETRQAISHPARLGSAQIGNWDLKDRKLSGRIDELVILGRSMGDAEVRSLFEAGTPYEVSSAP
jgi:hypothetical protein